MSEQNKIDEIKEALAAATPGPWEWREGKVQQLEQGRFFGSDGTEICWFGNYTPYYPTSGDEPEKEDINLIAKAPEYITYLLQEIERKDEALRFYADEETYEKKWEDSDPEIEGDRGEIAREAL